MKFFKERTIEELQIELRALVDTVEADNYLSSYHKQRYEELLYKIYKLGEIPDVKIINKKI